MLTLVYAKILKLSWSICIMSCCFELDTATRAHLNAAAEILATPSVYDWIQLFSSLVFVDQGIYCTCFSINKVAKEAKVFLASAF